MRAKAPGSSIKTDREKGGTPEEIAAIWESDSAFAYVTISITERKGKPGRKSLEKIAASVVPGFF